MWTCYQPPETFLHKVTALQYTQEAWTFVSVFRTADPVTSNLIQWAVYPVGVFSQSGNRVPAKSSDSTAQATCWQQLHRLSGEVAA